jgi:hypothetical protein
MMTGDAIRFWQQQTLNVIENQHQQKQEESKKTKENDNDEETKPLEKNITENQLFEYIMEFEEISEGKEDAQTLVCNLPSFLSSSSPSRRIEFSSFDK